MFSLWDALALWLVFLGNLCQLMIINPKNKEKEAMGAIITIILEDLFVLFALYIF